MNHESRTKSAARRRRGLLMEPLEARGLLSVLPVTWHGGSHGHLSAPGATPAIQVLAVTGTQTPTDAGGGLPTPHELARQQFVGKMRTNYVVGPGRFTDQAKSVSLYGSGFSSMASHTNIQLILFTPKDPVNGTITGQAALTGRDVGSTGTQLGIDLVGDPASEVNGLPTHFTWTVNGSSGGIFSGSNGQGELQVRYVSSGPVRGRGFHGGRADIAIQGVVNVVGVYNNLSAAGNRP